MSHLVLLLCVFVSTRVRMHTPKCEKIQRSCKNFVISAWYKIVNACINMQCSRTHLECRSRFFQISLAPSSSSSALKQLGSCDKTGLMGLRVKYSKEYVIKVPSARASGTLQKQISALLKPSISISIILFQILFTEMFKGKLKRMQ